MTEESSCAVCHQPIPQGRVHYGGVSCYSCRAFFRRNTQREELPVCKGEKECSITYIDRKQCSSCRYDKCIRIGMRPELVLTENDKKRRFKKLIRKKEEEAANTMSSPELFHSEEDFLHSRVHNIPALQPIETCKTNAIPFSSRMPFSNSTTTFAQNMYSLKYSNRSQYWNMFDMNNNQNYNLKNKDFLSEMRSEVQDYVINKKYETIHQPYYNKAGFRSFPCPPSSRVGYEKYTKDFQARCYFENKGDLLENVASPAWRLSPTNSVSSSSTSNSYSVSPHSPVSYSTPPPSPVSYSSSPSSPVSYSITPPSSSSSFSSSPSTVSYPVSYLSEQPSYISDHIPVSVIKSQNPDHRCTGIVSQADSTENQCTGVLCQTQEESKQRQIKLEPEDKEDKCDTEPEESMQHDTYYQNKEVTKEHDNENDDPMFNYVHKKFRTHLENSKISSDTNILHNRKSVIFHASSSIAMCVA